MKLKKTVSAVLAGAMLLGTSAFAKDNIYAYNKFISTVIGPQVGYCDFAASFAGHENEYDNVNNYFSGLISAFYDDIDMDFDNELITVESSGVSVYQGGENGVTFLGSIDTDLIANYGNSYANVFTIPVGNKKYIGVETFSSVDTTYLLQMYMLDPDTDELQPKVKIEKTVNEDGREENVWANGKTYYSYTLGEGLQTVMNPDNYKDSVAAARAALTESNIPDAFVASYDRMWFGDDKNNTDNLTQNQKNLLDLKIRLIKAEYELNFYLTGYENLSQFYDDKEKLDRIFVDSYVSLMDHNLYDFVEKIDRIKESDFFYKTDDRKIQNFLKSLEDIKNLDDDEIIKQKGRIKNRIRKMEMAASEIEYVLLGSLPRNYYS